MRFLISLMIASICFGFNGFKFKPLEPLPYDKQKALLGKKIFKDTSLSPKQDISCAKCHDISIGYSGVARLSDVGLDEDSNYNANIPYPSVINAGHNYLYYHDASAYTILQQVKKSFENKIEMGTNKEYVERMLRSNDEYKKLFDSIYNSAPNYEDAIDAVVEFEKSLTSLDSKFDLYLKGKAKLNEDEKQGFAMFRSYACDTCHSGVNFGGNIVAKLNDNNYAICAEDPLSGYFDTTHNEVDKNYIRVPSLRNVTNRLRHAKESEHYIDKIIFKMVFCKLGLTPEAKEVEKIKAFLYTLQGQKPEILDEE